MRRRSLFAGALPAAAALLLGTGAGAELRAETVALLPVQDRAGDSAAVRALEGALARGLAEGHALVDRELLRDALRRRRIRNLDAAHPAELRELGGELGADRFVTAVVHLAEREVCPRLAVSARGYDAATGEVSWAGFEAGSGLDRRGLLGLGVVEALEPLAEDLAARLLDGLRDGGPVPAAGGAVVALVPLSGLSETEATRAAETVTEAVRAALQGAGIPVLSPNRVADALRSERVFAWGALDVPVRRALAEAGAELLLTGSVEGWEAAGDGLEPEPVVAVALRAVDARTGRIVWAGALDRRGWDRQGLFRLGRVHDHGTLAARIAERLVAGLAGVEPNLQPSGEPSP